MRWGVPRCEVLIAVGDQRRERVHMVGVLYHWNLIRLREKGTIERQEEMGVGENKKSIVNIWMFNHRLKSLELLLMRDELSNSGYTCGTKPSNQSGKAVVCN